jgi:hypothetical protein
MGTFRYPGPICQTRDWFEDLDEGTLAKSWPSSAAPIGTLVPAAAAQASPAAATGDCAYLNPRGTSTVVAPPQAFDRLRGGSGQATISQPKPVSSFTWPYGPPSPAVEQQVTIGGQSVTVVSPTEAEARGKNLPTVNQVAEALRAIPATQRARTTRVILCPRSHPASTATRIVGGEGGSGEITLFQLVGKAQTQSDFDNRLMHESGHNVQGDLWKSSQDVKDWKDAAAQDNRLPSPYAGENAGEDFCEFLILFNAARGTGCEAAARQLYPNRWAKMSRYQV